MAFWLPRNEVQTVYLKALEIQGFKSFPNKTVMRFEGNITAIVGPNGSGKSNISDAIRWVLGEQSSRTLRGGKMEDVIFGGTERRNQVGFAEVSLILDNTARIFPLEESEVMVTRRYYRSGESEYYINRRSVRLKDVTELFMDTGLGRDGYSVIGQGRIDEILSVKSSDRRDIFEEAAGISRFRYRKEEAQRKLERTEDNLQRIGDRIGELELQVGPLREQAEKAKQYLLLRDELRGLEVSLWLDGLDKLKLSSRKTLDDFENAVRQRDELQAAVEKLYAQSESDAVRMREKDVEADAVRFEVSGLEAKCSQIDSAITVLKNNVQNNLEQIDRLTRELSEQSARAKGILDQMEERRARIRELEAARAGNQDRMERLLQEALRTAEQAGSLTAEVEALRAKEALENAALSAAQAKLSGLAASAQELYDRDSSVRAELAGQNERAEETRRAAFSLSEELKKAREESAALQNVIQGYLKRKEGRESKASAAQERLMKLRMEDNALRSRISMLEEMEKVYEGFSKAVKVVMGEAERGSLRGIHGPLASLIKVPDPYAVAVETALGPALQHIVTEREEDAKAAIESLKRRDAGRATFLPLSAIRGRDLREEGVERERGFVGVASQLLQYEKRYGEIVGNLLGRTVIAERLDDAIAIAKKYGHRFRIVTLDGQVLNPGGSMTGGSVSQNAGILSRANELERIREQNAALQEQLKEAAADLEHWRRELEAASYELDVARGEQRQLEDKVLRLTAEEEHYRLLLEGLEQNRAALEEELRRLGERSGKTETEMQETRAEIERREKAAAALRADAAARSAGQEELQEDAGRISEQIAALRAAEAALEAEQNAAQNALRELEGLHREFGGDREQRERYISEYRERNEAMEAEILEHEREKARLLGHLDTLKERIRQISEEKLELEAKRTQCDRECQEKNRELLQMERECARLEQKKATAALEEKQILDRLWDTYGLSHAAALNIRMELESTAKAGRRAAELRREINALGTPNIGAIEEFERVNGRYEYLTGQRDDVLRAKVELEQIIRDISEEMKTIFAREFKLINQCFGETFTELFGGGRAALELEDESDILNCGIEIKVQPPGKTLKVLSLLSGGEKAFVAIALYFAILKVRPTPFCVLDEIEAALDEVNVVRFARYLREMSDKTQFLVITHRRGTMEEADVLYGVTMQEQGVSRLLTVNLNELERELNIR